jgi:lipoprotein-anchoring transpeptidase ErfK/SrfK
MAAVLVLAASAQAARVTRGAPIAPQQEAVSLLDDKPVFARPQAGSKALVVVAFERPITLTRTTLPVLAQTQDSVGNTWLKVRLPGRVFDRRAPPPSGWITASNTRRASLRWHLVVDVDARRVLAYRDGRLLRSFGAIVGTPSTPTPRGEFFVEERLRMPIGAPGGPYALAASARSRVYQEFAGGPGQIALHGVNGIGGQIGTAVSHGCVRLTTEAVTWLAQYITAGVPLTIR